ncbi:MAG TPA: hypothetical protein VFM88_13825 [Vicinamibacteria bacterium]|nr:hypothetical protein [Vicinamibacteria bacterium]
MKPMRLIVTVSCLAAPAAFAQEHFTEGPVWECGAYRTKQGHFDDYMKYLRQNFIPPGQEAKKAGLVLDQKVFLKVPESPSDPDVLICTLHASFGKALDFDAGDDAKAKEIASRHFKTADEQKQREMTANRFGFRDFLGTSHYREVTLKPLP